eukprot:scaffold5959_cov57-Cylindrotheca_fusiformis.AAC.2
MARQSKRSSCENNDAEEQQQEHQPSRKRLRMSIAAPNNEKDDNKEKEDCKNVRVVARIRPLLSTNEAAGTTRPVISARNGNSSVSSSSVVMIESSASAGGGDSPPRCYEYDAVFGPESTQIQVYQQSGAQNAVCSDILQGFNCTILAYGQTGSGKTCK